MRRYSEWFCHYSFVVLVITAQVKFVVSPSSMFVCVSLDSDKYHTFLFALHAAADHVTTTTATPPRENSQTAA